LEDLVEELIGEITDEYDVEEPGPTQLRGGELEVDGLLNLDEFAEQTGVQLPEGPYETVAGYVLATLGELPGVGAEVEVHGHKLTVTELDGRRVARVRVGPAGADPAAGGEPATPARGEKAASPPSGERTPQTTGHAPPQDRARDPGKPHAASQGIPNPPLRS